MPDEAGHSDDAGLTRQAVVKLGGGAAIGAALPTAAASPASEIVMLDAVALASAIRNRKLSAVEVMTAHLDQIDRHNPQANAIVALQDRAGLLQQAAARDQQLRRGDSIGPLHGFPHAVKDLQPVTGIVSTQGSPIFGDFVPKTEGIMVERLRRAGVIFVGKTNTPEFGLGSHTVNPVYGATRNAWNPTKTAGGSSGGAAVALALRMVPLADGSDFGGSLRNPAGWNNVMGFRTSAGRIPQDGPELWLPSMGVLGPMARSIADLALLLSVQAGEDARAPLSLDGSIGSGLDAEMKGKRIAWVGDWGGMVPTEPEVLTTCRTALKTFETIGCHVEEAVPDFPVADVWRALVTLRGWRSGGGLAELYADPAKRRLLNDQAIFEVETGRKLSAFDVTAASVVRSRWYEAVRRFFDRYDYVVAPTAQMFPFDIDLKWPTSVAGTEMTSYHEWMKGVCLITMAGCPAMAVPAGFGAAGLPIGLQIIAANHRERACLQLGRAWEQASPLTRTHLPPALKAA